MGNVVPFDVGTPIIVSYNPTGGTNAPASQTVTAGETVTYDPAVLTLDAIDKGAVFSRGSFTSDKATGLVQWYYTETNENTTATGVLFTLTFRVRPGAAGSYPVTVGVKDNEDGNFTDLDAEPVPVTFTPGAVRVPTVSGGAVTAAVTGGGLSVRLTPPQGVTFTGGCCAAYDQNGRMLGTVSFTSGDSVLTLPCDGSKANIVKAFFLDSAGRPVVQAAECPVG